MLERQIEELREKLNRSIEEEADFDIIYKISTELDKLIAKYYRQKEAK